MQCTRCKIDKPDSDFAKTRKWCIDCKKEYSRKYYSENKKKASEYQKKYYIENKEVLDARTKQYVEDNREAINAYNRKRAATPYVNQQKHEYNLDYYIKNRERLLEYKKDYRNQIKANKEAHVDK